MTSAERAKLSGCFWGILFLSNVALNTPLHTFDKVMAAGTAILCAVQFLRYLYLSMPGGNNRVL